MASWSVGFCISIFFPATCEHKTNNKMAANTKAKQKCLHVQHSQNPLFTTCEHLPTHDASRRLSQNNKIRNRCVSCKVQELLFGLLLAQTIMAKIGNLSKRVARSLYKRGVFTKSIPEETRTITVPSLSGL